MTRVEVRDMRAIFAMVGEELGVTIEPELALLRNPEGLADLRALP